MAMRRERGRKRILLTHGLNPPIEIASIRGSLPPAYMVNQFFYIEAILRGRSMTNAYREGDRKALMAKLREQGLPDLDPFRGEHHALVQEPRPISMEEQRDWAIRGTLLYEDGVKFIDLAAAATRPRNHLIKAGSVYKGGASDGLAEALSYLRSKGPRYLCLCVDITQPLAKIKAHFAELLRKRRQQMKPIAEPLAPPSHYERQDKVTFKNVKDWVGNLMCYDLRTRHKRTLVASWEAVYGEDPIAAEKATTAVRRVKGIIEWAEKGYAHWPPPKIK